MKLFGYSGRRIPYPFALPPGTAVAARRHKHFLRWQGYSVHASGKVCPDGPSAAAVLLPGRAGVLASVSSFDTYVVLHLVRFDTAHYFLAVSETNSIMSRVLLPNFSIGDLF